MTLVAICVAIPQRMRLSGTVVEIWRLKHNGVTTLTFWGSRDVIGHVTIRLPGIDFQWMVHSDHVSVWHCYGIMVV